MGTHNTVTREVAPPQRQPATPAPARTASTVTPTNVQLLQRRLGNQGTAAFIARSALHVSSPHDASEREATAKAAEVLRSAAPAEEIHSLGASGAQRRACTEVQREAAGPDTAPHDVSKDIHADMTGGSPLPAGVRGFMEPRFGADFGNVRVHTDDRAAHMSESLNAHAFTVGNHVFFGKGQYRPETPGGKELIAHELTHTIQQGGAAQRSAGAMVVQRDEDKRSWWEKLTDWDESLAWNMARAVAPSAVPILQKGPSGVLDVIGEKVGAALDAVINKLMAPVHAITGVGETLSALFAPMLSTLQTAAGQIARNDCTPLREAADKIEKTAQRIITPIVEKLQPVVAKVKEFLNMLWDKIGAPIWGWIKAYAQAEWDYLQWLFGLVKSFYSWIWDKTAWIRSMAEKAWTWIKNKLGIGEGAEGQDGLLQWVQAKVEAAWNALKAKIEPFKKELTALGLAIGGVLLVISPAGPVLAIGAAVAAAIQGLRWIAANWGKGDAIVQARAYLEKTLIPSLLGATNRLTAAVARMAASINSALGSLAAGMRRMVGSLGGTILRFAVSAVQWLADQATALAAWGTKQLGELSHWLTGALEKLQAFLKQMLALLGRVGAVILDIYGLPILLGEKVWNLIPACIRDPIVDFLGPIILSQIELFSELGKDNEAWQKTKAAVMKIIHLVFKDHDLIGAVKAVFLLVLRVFNIPPDLLVKVGAKAMAAWDVVSKKPLDFIKNTVRSIGYGFKILGDNLWQDLKDGLQGWLFGEVKEQKINPPASWTSPKDLFFFVLEVLGLTVDHMWELLAQRFDPVKVAAVRKRLGQVAKVLDWINNAIDTTKTPKQNAEGIWEQAKSFGGTILTGIANWIATKVTEELAIMATAAAASGGLSEVLDVLRRVYKALVTAKRYARSILDMVHKGLDNVLDIAGGSVTKVGIEVHKLMKMGMPVVIGFLAEQVGLGGVGQALRDTIMKLRTNVDAGILWFIDKIKAGLEAIIGALKAGVAAVLDWWRERRNFKTAGGEPHSLYFRGDGPSAYLVVASQERGVDELLAPGGEFERAILASGDPAKANALTTARAANTAVKTAQTRLARDPHEEGALRILRAQFNSLADAFTVLGVSVVTTADLPDTVITFSSTGTKAGTVTAAPLSKKGSGGSRPDPVIEGWAHVQYLGTGDWEKTHLVSQELHGPGRFWNLVPARRTDNAWMREGPERTIKTMRDQNAVLFYEVTVNGYHSLTDPATGQAIDGFPTGLSIKMSSMKKEGATWVRDVALSGFPFKTLAPPPLKGGRGVDLKYANDIALRQLGIPRGVAGNVSAVKPAAGFADEADFRARMNARYAGLTPPYNVNFDAVHWPTFQALIAADKAHF
jgi:hypothetical protein